MILHGFFLFVTSEFSCYKVCYCRWIIGQGVSSQSAKQAAIYCVVYYFIQKGFVNSSLVFHSQPLAELIGDSSKCRILKTVPRFLKCGSRIPLSDISVWTLLGIYVRSMGHHSLRRHPTPSSPLPFVILTLVHFTKWTKEKNYCH